MRLKLNARLSAPILVLLLGAAGCGTDASNAGAAANSQPWEGAGKSSVEPLAALTVDHVTVEFFELARGKFIIVESGEGGDAGPILDPEIANRPVTELYSMLAGDRSVPEALVQAEARAAERAVADRELATDDLERGELGPEPLSAVGGGEQESDLVLRAAPGSAAWFEENFCDFGGVDYQWCLLDWWNGAYASSRGDWVHRGHGYVYLASGSQVQFKVNVNDVTNTGSGLVFSKTVTTNKWQGYYFHDGHTLWWDDHSLLRYNVSQASGDRFHFSGWMINNDAFVCGPGC